jgi:hypothetical protein
VAAANARSQHAGRAIKVFDLLPEARPELVTFEVPMVEVVDACTPDGIAALGFSESFPYGVTWPPCQAIAREAHAAALACVAARSDAEATATACVGEELALFEGLSSVRHGHGVDSTSGIPTRSRDERQAGIGIRECPVQIPKWRHELIVT